MPRLPTASARPRRVAERADTPPMAGAPPNTGRIELEAEDEAQVERTRIEPAPVGLEFAEEEPLTMLDARIAIGLPIEPEAGRAPRPPSIEKTPAPVPTAAEEPEDRAASRRGLDRDFLAKIGTRAPDAAPPEPAAPASAPAVKLPAPAKTSERPAALQTATARLIAAAEPKAAAAARARAKQRIDSSGPSEVLSSEALREYLLGTFLLLAIAAAAIFGPRDEGQGTIVARQEVAAAPVRQGSWKDEARAAPKPPPPPAEFMDTTPRFVIAPPEPLPEPEPQPKIEPAPAVRRTKNAAPFLAVRSQPAGAAVLIDGISKGRTPLLDPKLTGTGAVEVTVTLEGFKPWTAKISPDESGNVVVNAKLEPR